MAILTIVVMLFAFSTSSDPKIAKPSPEQTPITLQADSSRTVHVPDFSSQGDAKCDASGNMFFDVDDVSSNAGSLLEISRDGSRTSVYTPRGHSAGTTGDGVQLMDFAVAPSGGVHELMQSQKEVFVLDFDSDGDVKHRTRLEVPDHVEAKKLAVFDDGVMYFAGFFTRLAPVDQRGASYVALFESSGKLRTRLTGYPAIKLAELGTKIPEGAALTAQDGNLYVLSPDKVTVVSENGDIVRSMPFTKPDPETSAVRLDVSEGLLSIVLAKTGKNHLEIRKYLVIYAVTGEKFGYYEASAELGNTDVCFSRTDGYAFTQGDNGQLKLINAHLR